MRSRPRTAPPFGPEMGVTVVRGEDAAMGPTARWLQALGILLFLATAFFPLHCAELHPLHVARQATHPQVALAVAPPGVEAVPAREIYDAVRVDLAGEAHGFRTWEVRRWYPYALALFWLWALLWVAGPPAAAAARRARAGAVLLTLTVGVAVLEACYLAVEYAPLLPQVLGRAEALIAWALVVAILFLRRGTDRRVGAVEGHVGAMALLSLLHLLTLPSSEARPWLGPYAWSDVCSAVGTNFRPAFWLACGGLALASAATYFSRRRAGAEVPAAPPEPVPEPVGARG